MQLFHTFLYTIQLNHPEVLWMIRCDIAQDGTVYGVTHSTKGVIDLAVFTERCELVISIPNSEIDRG